MNNTDNKSNKSDNICFFCKKASHILNKCRCENTYCLKHLTPEKHKCSYNFKLDKESDYKNMYVKLENRVLKI